MTKKETLSSMVKCCVNTALTIVYFMFAYFISCLLLNSIIPRLIPTTHTAQQFSIFGIVALMFCGGGFALFKAARDPAVSLAQGRVFKAMCFAFEGLIFVGAIAIWIKAGQYATWVGQFEPITANSGVDIRYWVASVLFTNGVFGNLLAALLTA